MRRQDIKTGVVYAYQPNPDRDAPKPLMFLSADLHIRAVRHPVPWCRPSLAGERAGYKSLHREYTGYPAILAHGIDPAEPEMIALAATVASNALTTGDVPEGLQLDIITNLAHIRGPYAEAQKKWDEMLAVRRQRFEQSEALTRQRHERAEAVIGTLALHGISAHYGDSTIRMSLDAAEKLTALLAEQEG